jgi:hypothetical protein
VIFLQFPQHVNLKPPIVTDFSLSSQTIQSTEVIPPPPNQIINLVSKFYPVVHSQLSLPDYAHHAARIMAICHTDALGGHIEECPDGHISRIFYNSCGHRFCPRCAGRIRQRWLADRIQKILPVRHYHTIFTLSHTFNSLWHYNPCVMGNLLFHSAIGALKALLADPKWLGAEVGITATLETWDDRMLFHPHLHCLVTGGGITPEGEWLDVENPRCLVPVKPLMWEFRKRFCKGLRKLLNEDKLTIPKNSKKQQWLARTNKVNRQNWSVFIAKQPEDGGPDTNEIMSYLSENVAGGPLSGIRLIADPSALSSNQLNYLKAAPIHENRLTEIKDGMVGFCWGSYDSATGKRERNQVEKLPIQEFFQRYLQHVPPTSYQSVRHYGLYTSAQKKKYDRCVELLTDRIPENSSYDTITESVADNDVWISNHSCPVCSKALIVTGHIPSSSTGQVIKRVPLGKVSLQPLHL